MDKKHRMVLVVEDNLEVRRPLVKFLEMHGFSVAVAETEEEGLRELETKTFIAAIVDLRLRKGSGREVVTKAPPQMPVLIFSGVPSESNELERVRPLTRLIEKPYSLILLIETLTEMLDESGNPSTEYSDPAPKG
jgi:DNA-binding response OmpR family regulator